MFNRSLELRTGGLQWTRGELLGEGSFGRVSIRGKKGARLDRSQSCLGPTVNKGGATWRELVWQGEHTVLGTGKGLL